MSDQENKAIIFTAPFQKRNLIKHRTKAVFDWLAKKWVTDYSHLDDAVELCEEFSDIKFEIVDVSEDYFPAMRKPLVGAELKAVRDKKRDRRA